MSLKELLKSLEYDDVFITFGLQLDFSHVLVRLLERSDFSVGEFKSILKHKFGFTDTEIDEMFSASYDFRLSDIAKILATLKVSEFELYDALQRSYKNLKKLNFMVDK